MTKKSTTFRAIILAEFEKRRAKNPSTRLETALRAIVRRIWATGVDFEIKAEDAESIANTPLRTGPQLVENPSPATSAQRRHREKVRKGKEKS